MIVGQQQPAVDESWIEFSSHPTAKRKPPSLNGPCVTALREAQAINARCASGELSRDEADELIEAIVKGVE